VSRAAWARPIISSSYTFLVQTHIIEAGVRSGSISLKILNFVSFRTFPARRGSLSLAFGLLVAQPDPASFYCPRATVFSIRGRLRLFRAVSKLPLPCRPPPENRILLVEGERRALNSARDNVAGFFFHALLVFFFFFPPTILFFVVRPTNRHQDHRIVFFPDDVLPFFLIVIRARHPPQVATDPPTTNPASARAVPLGLPVDLPLPSYLFTFPFGQAQACRQVKSERRNRQSPAEQFFFFAPPPPNQHDPYGSRELPVSVIF